MTTPAPAELDTIRFAGDRLDVENLTVTFGGHTAVRDATLSAARGAITGLIGPNGAGKSTIFNACSGLVRPRHGTITLFGHDITRQRPASRARRGLGRTFQRTELVDGMSVRENVLLGAECRAIGGQPLLHLLSPARQREAIDVDVDRALEACHIAELADRKAATLSTGQRRLVELARVVAAGFDFLLLDEPSSGLDERETARFGATLSSLVADRSIGILLVEHDMQLVMGACERIYVLDFGTMIFSGTAPEVQASAVVQAAYLGDESVEASA